MSLTTRSPRDTSFELRRTPDVVGPGRYETSSVNPFVQTDAKCDFSVGSEKVAFLSSTERELEAEIVLKPEEKQHSKGQIGASGFNSFDRSLSELDEQDFLHHDSFLGPLNLIKSKKQDPFEPSKDAAEFPGPGEYESNSFIAFEAKHCRQPGASGHSLDLMEIPQTTESIPQNGCSPSGSSISLGKNRELKAVVPKKRPFVRSLLEEEGENNQSIVKGLLDDTCDSAIEETKSQPTPNKSYPPFASRSKLTYQMSINVNQPGPGEYFPNTRIPGSEKIPRISSACFRSGTTRDPFKTVEGVATPGPGRYGEMSSIEREIEEEAHNRKINPFRSKSPKKRPFSSTEARHCCKKVELGSQVVGPGKYVSFEANYKQKNMKSSSFSGKSRITFFDYCASKGRREDRPFYNLPNAFMRKKSVFPNLYRSNRKTSLAEEANKNLNPSPSDYNVKSDWVPCGENKQGVTRFVPRKTIFDRELVSSCSPGPAMYHYLAETQSSPGKSKVFLVNSRRFETNDSLGGNIGPGAYFSNSNSLTKRSFSILFQETSSTTSKVRVRDKFRRYPRFGQNLATTVPKDLRL